MYKNNPTGINWVYNTVKPRENAYMDSVVKRFKLSNYSVNAATFCLSITDACNLNCAYCFNKQKTKNTISFEDAKKYLDFCFEKFGGKDKYYIDLSGKGEPLLYLKLILKIKEYCVQKSNELQKEVEVRFATNGTLLIKETADILEKHGIWFIGISLDGNKEAHDKYRKTKDKKPTYDTILNNVKAIEHHELMGCAVSLTKNVFSLVESIKELSDVFKTIGYKPVRACNEAFDKKALENWCIEYDKLATFLLDETINNNFKYIKTILNGEDYFGKFIRHAFTGEYYIVRCDAGIGRFALDTDGKIYCCPAAYEFDELCFGSVDDFNAIEQNMLFYEQIDRQEPCASCNVRYICGGECLVEKRLTEGTNEIMCAYKKHLIYLAMWFRDTLKENNTDAYNAIKNFCVNYADRFKIDTELQHYMQKHTSLTFTEAKEAYDKETNQDIEPY